MEENQKPRKVRPRRSAQVKQMDEQISDRLRRVRQSIYAEGDGKLEVRAAQRELLAAELGISPRLLEAIEKKKRALGAAHLLTLMQRFGLSADYFLNAEAPLPNAVVLEQRLARLTAQFKAQGGTRRPPGPRRARRKGGWMKGLPRKVKTDRDAAIIEAWKAARDEGLSFANIKELMEWRGQ